MRPRSPACPHRARSGARGAWLLARSLRRDRYSPDQEGESGAPPCGPPDAGTDAPAAIRRRPPWSRSVDLSYFHRATVFNLRVVERQLNGLVITGRFNGVIA